MQTLTLLPGRDKAGNPEPFDQIALRRGELCTTVGNTAAARAASLKISSSYPTGTA